MPLKNTRVQKNKILIFGSIAYDHLMRFDGTFSGVLLPESLHSLSLSLLASDRSLRFGGCGGIMAVHLKRCGGEPLLVSIVGNDFQNYEAWLAKNGVDTKLLIRADDLPCASAFIVSDSTHNQIAIFDPGAAKNFTSAPELDIDSAGVSFAIIGPTNKELMLFAADLCASRGIPYFFDPGQMIHVFSRQELELFLARCAGLFCNEYEMSLLQRTLGIEAKTLRKNIRLVVETLGERGSRIAFENIVHDFPALPVTTNDPTGAGDVYRAAFLSEIQNDFPALTAETIKRAGFEASRLASEMLAGR